MIVTITGASGLVGRRVSRLLAGAGHTVRGLRHTEPPEPALEGADALVHLAGEPVPQRWTPTARARIRESRVAGTETLVRVMAGLARRPAVLVCASAVGYYGSRGDEVLTEQSAPGSGFLSEVCVAWERAADMAAPLGIRVVKLRIGMVLAADGGALARMAPAFRWFAGGRLGSGRQWVPWIHVDDVAALVRFTLEQPVAGVFNATAPNPAMNAAFTEALAAALHRPAVFPAPAFALRALFGEMAQILLASQRAIPRAALDRGFAFAWPELGPALADLVE